MAHHHTKFAEKSHDKGRPQAPLGPVVCDASGAIQMFDSVWFPN